MIGVALIATAVTAAAASCGVPGSTAAAVANAASLNTLVWHPFGRVERGWATYFPRIGVELRTVCPVATPGFAGSLAAWQRRHKLSATGVFDAASFTVMKGGWQALRPFAHINGKVSCPAPPPAAMLARSSAAEGYGGKQVQLRTGVLAAYRAMVKAAREDAGVAAEKRSFLLFSGYRDPAADALRCATEGNCNGIVRATCSAHRTGLALDMWVGQFDGYGPDSSADANRAAMVQTAGYRWLIVNAARFGFVNYAFEPWHWEWTGEPVVVTAAT